VKQHMANERQGTHKALEKSEVSGSTRKLKRQKGTGGARAGSIKNPLFRGGARIFGPRPRDYSFKLNKKLKKLARISALSYKVKEEKIQVVEDFSFEQPKTKQIIDLLKGFSLTYQKTLVIVPGSDKKITLSARNLENVMVIQASDINTYDILNADNLLITEGSVRIIEEQHKEKA